MSLKSTSLKARGLRCLWDEAEVLGARVGKDHWRQEKGGQLFCTDAQLSSWLLQGTHAQKMAALAYSEGGVLAI